MSVSAMPRSGRRATRGVPGAPRERAALRRAADACRRRYAGYPNVIGVGTGLKYVGGRARDLLCVQFYVRRKVARPGEGRLPRFVWARRRDGSIVRSRRVPTDVIELRRLGFACRSGEPVEALGEAGALTLLFRNKAPGAARHYVLTCAHVAGDVRQSPPVEPALESACCARGRLLARTLANATHAGGTLAYDIAVAEVAPACLPQPELRVVGSARPLRRFLRGAEIAPGLGVSCAFPVSNAAGGTVASDRVALPLRLDGREYTVENLFLLGADARPGDSGGLVYEGEAAIGILVGRAEGWSVFQPLDEAFAHVRTLVPEPLECFRRRRRRRGGAR